MKQRPISPRNAGSPSVPPRVRRTSRPLLSEVLQASLSQILRAHQNAKFTIGLEFEKEGLGKSRYIRRSLYVNHKNSPTFSILLREVGRLRLDCFEDMPNDL